jgi:exonuclease V gamma subunit
MNSLILAADADLLADRLLDDIAASQRDADPFQPVEIVIPNRFVEQWLKFRMARARGVAINVNFSFLEHALWGWLREIDPRPFETPPELLDEERYELMILSILWNDTSPAFDSVQLEFGPMSSHATRRGCRRAWAFAERFAGLFRDYEYHRQDAIVQPWLDPKLPREVARPWREREATQREIFRRIVEPNAGRRAALNQAAGRMFKTFPQYVMELDREIRPPLKHLVPPRRRVHLFGLSLISPLHIQALELVARFHECRMYQVNPLSCQLPATPTARDLHTIARRFRGEGAMAGSPLRVWGRAAAESLDVTANLLKRRSFEATTLSAAPPTKSTTLARLQSLLRGHADRAERSPPDLSLQIAPCPGVWREAEAIHAAIIHMLNADPTLRQSDIAVLVSDMEAYRPALAAVFDRPPRTLSYGLADYSAARVSVYGQALIGMLDAALDRLSRDRVLDILLNPCVLARFGVTREAALHWQTWAKNLGIYHGWNAAEKRDLGYRDSPLYSWKLGLQKLRMGRYMTVVPEDSSEPAPAWNDVLPFADVESGDRDRLDPFCRLVEGLLPLLVRLRGLSATGAEWAETLTALVQRFLAIPDDRPEEEPVRDALLESLRRLAESGTSMGEVARPMPLALVREILAGRLREIPGRRNDALASGVTIAALKPQRPVPFDVVFIAGMGERHFPGSAAPSSFDLRQMRRQPGDILPVDQQRLSFLEAVLSARKKLIITYNARDLQKDETLQPAIAVAQLQRFVSMHVTSEPLKTTNVPLTPHDAVYLETASRSDRPDVLADERPADRVLALDLATEAGRIVLNPIQQTELDNLRGRYARSFPMPLVPPEPRSARPVSCAILAKFLRNPAEAALRYHVRAARDWDSDDDESCEPLVSGKWSGVRFIEQMLRSIVHRAAVASTNQIEAEWPGEFDRRYREATLRGQFPEGEFAHVDAELLKGQVQASLDAGLLEFLTGRSGAADSGPFLIGESETPLGAKRHFPALVLDLPRPIDGEPSGQCRIVGSWTFAWRSDAAFDLLVLGYGTHKDKDPLSAKLFEPLLFALTLVAIGEIGIRQVTFHLAGPKDVVAVPLCGELLQRDVARRYLSELAADFLDVDCADQLPFETLQKDFSSLYSQADGLDRGDELLRDFRERESDGEWGHQSPLDVFTELGFRVPDDAAVKLRRRFRPLFGLFPPPPEPKPKKSTAAKPRGRKGGAT